MLESNPPALAGVRSILAEVKKLIRPDIATRFHACVKTTPTGAAGPKIEPCSHWKVALRSDRQDVREAKIACNHSVLELECALN